MYTSALLAFSFTFTCTILVDACFVQSNHICASTSAFEFELRFPIFIPIPIPIPVSIPIPIYIRIYIHIYIHTGADERRAGFMLEAKGAQMGVACTPTLGT